MASRDQPDRMDERLDKVESACIGLTKWQAEINRQLNGIDTRLDGMDETLKIILERLS
ncbi:MAG: hypothetical protein J4F29_16690 [Candidatus Latescibacteria bacterium]|nr:hypothetical protein [Candidatus Latescibacterota bacterium]